MPLGAGDFNKRISVYNIAYTLDEYGTRDQVRTLYAHKWAKISPILSPREIEIAQSFNGRATLIATIRYDSVVNGKQTITFDSRNFSIDGIVPDSLKREIQIYLTELVGATAPAILDEVVLPNDVVAVYDAYGNIIPSNLDITTLQSGTSGYSGYSGIGLSGFSGYSGSGFSGFSGKSGFSGFSGYSGRVGTTGNIGLQGVSGVSGYSGYSGNAIDNTWLHASEETPDSFFDSMLYYSSGDLVGQNSWATLSSFPSTQIGGNGVICSTTGTQKGATKAISSSFTMSNPWVLTWRYTYITSNTDACAFMMGVGDLSGGGWIIYKIHVYNLGDPQRVVVEIADSNGGSALVTDNTMVVPWRTGNVYYCELRFDGTNLIAIVNGEHLFTAANTVTPSKNIFITENASLSGSQGFFDHIDFRNYGSESTGISGYSGISGVSGYSGYSGKSGYSGYSGNGISGYSGYSGLPGSASSSGYSGAIGASGYSGISGYSGYSGIGTSGFSGVSGFSGTSGFSGVSGYSGYSGVSGYSGYSGKSGYSGYSGISGNSGYSGISGASGYSGISGASGYSGISGTSGYSGYSGTSGYSGYSGVVSTTQTFSSGAGTVTPVGTNTYSKVNITCTASTITVGAPSGSPVDGNRMLIEFFNNSGGNLTVTMSAFAFGTDITSVSVVTNGKYDQYSCVYSSVKAAWLVNGQARGF